MVGCGSKNGQLEDTCLKVIELHAHILLIILSTPLIRIEGPM